MSTKGTRGRPPKDQGELAIKMDALDQMEQQAQNRISRDGRLNLAPQSKLDWAGKEDGFQYIWASDSPTYPVNLQQRLNAGWIFERHKAGEHRGERVIMNSKGCNLHLMKTPMEYYLEDEKIKQDKSLRQVQEISNQVGAREYAGESKELGKGKVAKHEFKEEIADAVNLMEGDS